MCLFVNKEKTRQNNTMAGFLRDMRKGTGTDMRVILSDQWQQWPLIPPETLWSMPKPSTKGFATSERSEPRLEDLLHEFQWVNRSTGEGLDSLYSLQYIYPLLEQWEVLHFRMKNLCRNIWVVLASQFKALNVMRSTLKLMWNWMGSQWRGANTRVMCSKS